LERRAWRREGKARVPDVAIFVTAARLEPPSYEEGFDRIWLVKTLVDGNFELEAQPMP